MKSLLLAMAVICLLLQPIQATCEAGVPCAGTSRVWAETYYACIGDTVRAYTEIRDCYGNLLPGKEVLFYTDRGAPDTFLDNPVITDQNGIATSTVTTATPGNCLLYVVTDAVVIGPSSPVFWDSASTTDRSTWGRVKSLWH